jgi:predicted acylesterase/phospholipase RssA
MIAFVLSGGANYGALQAGALTVLLEKGINPDMLVGTSAGALNAAWLARDPSLAGARKLEHLWSEHAPNLYRRSNGVGMLFQLIKGSDGLYSNQPLQRLITKLIGPETTFGDLSGPRLYLTAVRLLDGKFYVFGDREDEFAQALANPLVCLHHLTLEPQSDPGMWNFSDAAAMISDGRRAAQAFLAQESVSQRQ